MPLIFSELALAYPPEKVSNPALRIAAANGQFLLASREAYKAMGGHESVKGEILEDVQLAFIAKKRKVGLRFRYAADALSTRMYRTTGAMIEGWTKNLALLFGNCLILAAWRIVDIFLLLGLPLLAWKFWNYGIAHVPIFTAAIDPAGRVIARMPAFVQTAGLLPYNYESNETPYTRYGDWFAWACFALGFLMSAVSLARRRP